MNNIAKSLKLLQQSVRHLKSSQSLSSMAGLNFETLSVTKPKEFVYQVELNRPKKLNALNNTMWLEIGNCFKELEDSSDCRVVIITGAGKAFCAGIDLQDAMSLGQNLGAEDDVARRCRVIEKKIKAYQDAFLSIEKCRKPVIAAVNGLCIGGAFNMICAADIRYCSKDAWFSLKEVDIGMTADVGALQWLPKIIGSESLVRELAFTARKMTAEEALESGLVNRLFNDNKTLLTETLAIAEEISLKSPVAVQGTKRTLIHARDHSVEDGLEYIRNINQTMLQGDDFVNAAVAQATKGDPPVFSKL